MTKCIQKQGTKTTICAGDLDRLVNIYERKQYASNTESTDFNIQFKKRIQAWAMLDDTGGSVARYDNTATDPSVTHYFYIRYIPNLDSTCVVWLRNLNNKDGKYFNIVAVKNLEERSQWLRLDCKERGSDKQGNNFV